MRPSDNHLDRTWAEDRLEAYVDGLLSRKDRKTFESILAQDAGLARQVDLATRVRDDLRAIETPACPPAAFEPILELARRESRVDPPSVRDWLGSLLSPRVAPARLIVVASAILAAVLTLVVLVNQSAVQTTPGDDEVEAALVEVKLALSYVSRAGRETGSTIRHRAVDESIIDPMVRAIGYADIGSGEGQPVQNDRQPLEDPNNGGTS